MHCRGWLQRIIVWNQILMGVLMVVFIAFDMRLYAIIVLVEMMFMFAIWWKVIVGKI